MSNAAKPMPMKKTLLLVLGATFLAETTHAQLFADFESFETSAGTGTVMFRNPRFSGSTSGRLALTPDTSLVTDVLPAGNSSTRALVADFSYNTGFTDPWLRYTTAGTANLPNPTIDFTQNLAFQIYTDRPIQLALGVRETGTTAAIGANGGGTGNIEWVGATARNGGAPVPTRTIPAGIWTTVLFDVNGEPTVAFPAGTSNGTIDGTKGTLEHLAIIPADGFGAYKVYVDNFQVTPVPEPATYAMVFGCLALGGMALRRRFQK